LAEVPFSLARWRGRRSALAAAARNVVFHALVMSGNPLEVSLP